MRCSNRGDIRIPEAEETENETKQYLREIISKKNVS